MKTGCVTPTKWLADEQIIAAVYEALAQRPSQTAVAAAGAVCLPETVLRLLILKHVRNWSYDVLEREGCGPTWVYRDLHPCRWWKDAGCQDHGPLGPGTRAGSAQADPRTHGQNSPGQWRDHGTADARRHDGGPRPISTTRPTSTLLGDGIRVLDPSHEEDHQDRWSGRD